jgi:hypothetical protein
MAGDTVSLQKFQYNQYGSIIDGYKIIYNNVAIGQLSRSFADKIEDNLGKGYEIAEVQIEYVANWFEKKKEILCDIFLCRITLDRI